MRIVKPLLLLILLVSNTGMAAEIVQAPDRETGLYAVRTGDTWSLGRGTGDLAPLPLPQSFRAYRIEALSNGWIVTGSIEGPDGLDFVIVRGQNDRIEVLPQPGGRFGLRRGNPVPLVRDGVLQGVAWIEGNHQQELVVRAAQWNGTDWGPAEEVSPRGPGAQLALTATTLPNGDWLLLWAAFDGEDDEIRWSRRHLGVWSPPLLVHADNHIPDITPTVIATDTGALAAWSVLHEGHYRLQVALLDERGWHVREPSGGKGSLYPQAFRNQRGIELLFLSVIPEGWSLIELNRDGLEQRRIHIPEATLERPLLMPSDPDSVELAWPGAGPGGERRRALKWVDR